MIAIREADDRDAAILAELTTQLGYPSTSTQIAERLPLVRERGTAIFVADLPPAINTLKAHGVAVNETGL